MIASRYFSYSCMLYSAAVSPTNAAYSLTLSDNPRPDACFGSPPSLSPVVPISSTPQIENSKTGNKIHKVHMIRFTRFISLYFLPFLRSAFSVNTSFLKSFAFPPNLMTVLPGTDPVPVPVSLTLCPPFLSCSLRSSFFC